MEISPYVGGQELTASSVTVRVNPDDRKRAESLVARTSEIALVNNNDTFALAKAAAGQLKAMIEEIESARKRCQQPFRAVHEAIAQQAIAVGEPVAKEHKRILELLNNHVERLEAEQREAEKKRAEERKRVEAEHQRKVEEALAARRKAEEEARTAKDEVTRLKARAESHAALTLAAQEQLARELAEEISEIGNNGPKRGLVPGGRVNHSWEFKLVNVRETIRAGSLSLLRFELDKLACLDSVKAQLAIDANTEPSLPGIEVTRKLNVSVRPSAGLS
jgi:hypothetical protein